MIRHVNLNITGKVQNVGFRYHTKQMAEVLSVYGYVKNMYDGSVFIEVEGEEKNVNEFVEWCRKGPSRAVVENIEINGEAVSGFSDFKAIF